MTGVVNDDLEATLKIAVRDANGDFHEVETVIDTGFTGYLTVPAPVISAFGLEWICREEGQLADGSFHDFDVFEVTIIWNSQPRSVEVEAADTTPLLGMDLMQAHELRMQIFAGGLVSVDPIIP